MGKRLLLVDDEPRNLSVLEAHLAPLGHELLRANDGREALSLIASNPPDLVLLDLRMPGFDGLDVLAHIRARDEGDHIPVILVTAHTEREQRLRGLEAGADDFLEKPIDGAVLVLRVSRLLEVKESRDALRASRDELATRNEALRRLQREQQELTAFIVHDLKNPLAALWANLHFAIEELPEAESVVREALLDASEAARRLRAMIDDLLTISRLEEAQFPLAPELISLTELLARVAHEYVRVAEDRRIVISPPAANDIEVHGDRRLLQRVLENIVENSLRYTPANGRVAIAARRGGPEVVIAVSNTGPAIPREERARIFEKFARGELEERTRSNAGLGLYFCKRAVEALGGHIEVTQSAEWPTSFLVHLPTPLPWS